MGECSLVKGQKSFVVLVPVVDTGIIVVVVVFHVFTVMDIGTRPEHAEKERIFLFYIFPIYFDGTFVIRGNLC